MPDTPTYLDPHTLARVAHLGIRAQRIVEGAISGLYRSPFHGVSVEFADYREYTAGDDLKNLDWKVFARSDRYFIKRYEEETNLRCTILLDASASMKYGRVGEGKVNGIAGAPMTKFDYAATVAAAFTHLLIKQRDAVGLVTFDKQPRATLRTSSKPGQLHKLIDLLMNTQPGAETELGSVLERVAGQIASRGLVILISDMLGDLDAMHKALGRLRHGGHELMLIQVLDRDEVELPFEDAVLFQDIEGDEKINAEPWAFRKAYKQAMQDFLDEIKRRSNLASIDHLLLHTDEPPGLALSHYLHRRQMIGQSGRGGGKAKSGAART